MPLLETTRGSLCWVGRGDQKHMPIICLHGAGGTHQHWGLQLRALRRDTRTILLDLPGHGHSPFPACRTIESYTHTVIAFMNTLGIDRALIAGHSMGGAIAMTLALQMPSRVAALMIIGSGMRLPVLPAILNSLQHGDMANAVHLIIERAYAQSAPADLIAQGREAFLKTNPHVLADDLHACAAYTIKDQIHHIRCPTLLLCGDDDRITPLKFSVSLQQALPNATLTILHGAGHMALIEQPDRVNAAMSAFLVAQQGQSL